MADLGIGLATEACPVGRAAAARPTRWVGAQFGQKGRVVRNWAMVWSHGVRPTSDSAAPRSRGRARSYRRKKRGALPAIG